MENYSIIIIPFTPFYVEHFLKVYGYTFMFFCTVTKGNNFHGFLFAFLDDIALSKWDLFIKETICSWGANSFHKS